jgi:hypothetical protein
MQQGTEVCSILLLSYLGLKPQIHYILIAVFHCICIKCCFLYICFLFVLNHFDVFDEKIKQNKKSETDDSYFLLSILICFSSDNCYLERKKERIVICFFPFLATKQSQTDANNENLQSAILFDGFLTVAFTSKTIPYKVAPLFDTFPNTLYCIYFFH